MKEDWGGGGGVKTGIGVCEEEGGIQGMKRMGGGGEREREKAN